MIKDRSNSVRIKLICCSQVTVVYFNKVFLLQSQYKFNLLISSLLCFWNLQTTIWIETVLVTPSGSFLNSSIYSAGESQLTSLFLSTIFKTYDLESLSSEFKKILSSSTSSFSSSNNSYFWNLPTFHLTFFNTRTSASSWIFISCKILSSKSDVLMKLNKFCVTY